MAHCCVIENAKIPQVVTTKSVCLEQTSALPRFESRCLPSHVCMGDLWWACLLQSHTYTVYIPIGEKAGAAQEVAPKITVCKQTSAQVRDPFWLLNPSEESPEVENQMYQWPHEIDLGPKNICLSTLQR